MRGIGFQPAAGKDAMTATTRFPLRRSSLTQRRMPERFVARNLGGIASIYSIFACLCTAALGQSARHSTNRSIRACFLHQWKLINANAPFAARDGGGALVHDGRMWLLGGWNPGDHVHFPTKCNSEVWSSTDGVEWKLIHALPHGKDATPPDMSCTTIACGSWGRLHPGPLPK